LNGLNIVVPSFKIGLLRVIQFSKIDFIENDYQTLVFTVRGKLSTLSQPKKISAKSFVDLRAYFVALREITFLRFHEVTRRFHEVSQRKNEPIVYL
jgi:hypothetical protein